MQSFQEILKQRLKGSSIAPQAQASEICFYAQCLIEKYLGTEVAAQARVQSIQRDVVMVGVLHPALAEAIRMHHEALLEDLQKRFGKKRVSQIRTKCLTIL